MRGSIAIVRLAVTAVGPALRVLPASRCGGPDGTTARLGPRARPVVLTDGVCPDCGRVAPLAAVPPPRGRQRRAAGRRRHASARGYSEPRPIQRRPSATEAGDRCVGRGEPGAYLVRQFTGEGLRRAAGRRGRGRAAGRPGGHGGTAPGPRQPAVGSRRLRRRGRAADKHTGRRALRARLLRLVRRLRRGLRSLGMPLAAASCLPVQPVGPLPRALALRLADRMARRGIRRCCSVPRQAPACCLPG